MSDAGGWQAAPFARSVLTSSAAGLLPRAASLRTNGANGTNGVRDGHLAIFTLHSPYSRRNLRAAPHDRHNLAPLRAVNRTQDGRPTNTPIAQFTAL